MATKVTAIFEDRDTAELALHRLRGQNVPLQAFDIGPAPPDQNGRDHPVAPVVYVPGMLNGVGAFHSPSFMTAPLITSQAKGFQDPHGIPESRGTLLAVTVSDRDAARVRSTIISAHGKQVR